MTATVADPVAAVLASFAAMEGRLTELVGMLRGNINNAVLLSGSFTLDANGHYEISTPVPWASIAVHNTSAVDVVVTNSPAGSDAPARGRGVLTVPAGGFLCFPLTGNSLTIYGDAGVTVNVALFENPQPPTAGAGGGGGDGFDGGTP